MLYHYIQRIVRGESAMTTPVYFVDQTAQVWTKPELSHSSRDYKIDKWSLAKRLGEQVWTHA